MIVAAAARARGLGHSFVGSVHLLMALCTAGDGAGMLLRSASVTEQFVHDAAAVLCGVGTASLPLPQGFTREAREILRTAGGEAELLGTQQVKPMHLLLALTRRHDSTAVLVLRIAGVDPDELFTMGLRVHPVLCKVQASFAHPLHSALLSGCLPLHQSLRGQWQSLPW